MNLSFTLRKDKLDKKGFAPVRMVISINGDRIRKNVKDVKVKTTNWKNERVKDSNPKSKNYNFSIEYNQILDDLENKVKAIKRYALLNEIPLNKDYILEKLNDRNFSINNISHKFFDSFQEFIDSNRNIKSIGTTKKYTSTLNFLKDFSADTGYVIRFDNVNIEFYEKFREYAFEKRNTLNNYYGKLVSGTKTFMNWAFERGYHENLEFKKFKTIQNDIEVIYLTMDELMKLFNHNFDSRRLEHVKDFYCFGCFTGLRFSDIKKLDSSNVFDDHLRLNIIKTKTIDHKIPLNKYAIQILNKYKNTLYEPIPSISGQKFNKYIKECCQIVGIDKEINITRYIGNRRIDKVEPKHELITSHTARKTFVTNSLILGMKEMVVRNITGHNDEASFKKYVKIAEDFKKNEMSATWDKL